MIEVTPWRAHVVINIHFTTLHDINVKSFFQCANPPGAAQGIAFKVAIIRSNFLY